MAGEPHNTQGVHSWDGQAATGSLDKVRVIEHTILHQQKIKNIKCIGPETGATMQEINNQLKACNDFWSITEEASESEDYKVYSESEEWRANAIAADGEVLKAVECEGSRVLKHMTELVRTRHPDRAQATVNPAMLEAAMQPAIKQGLVSVEDVNHLISLARDGITIDEFRDFDRPALNLLEGNAEDPDDEDILLAFYMQQRAQGRCFILGPEWQEKLDSMGELVLSASFLVKVPGKKPRAVLNLSSTGEGVNQRMIDLLEANSEGYATIPDVCAMVVNAFIDMVLNPESHGISDVHQITLAMLVADADCAFTRVGVASKTVGVQAARIKGLTVIPMCCTFGWRRSAEVFSHITAGIKAAHASNLDEATFISDKVHSKSEVSETKQPRLAALLKDKMPAFKKYGASHVDDFTSITTMQKGRPEASAMDLLGAIKIFLGQDAISIKKFAESTFWARIQKVIGAYFDVNTLTVIMPRPKIVEVLAMLESPAFDSRATKFEIDLCASLRGKMRWAAYCTKLGDAPALIGIEMQRSEKIRGNKQVSPKRQNGETQEVTNAKFHNDIKIYKQYFRLLANNPRLASCSMVSAMRLKDRLKVPGQSKHLMWLSGDFSIEGQAYGVEGLHPKLGYVKRWAYIAHPPEVIAKLRIALSGKSTKGLAIVSTVLERQNKLFAEFHYRDLLAGLPTFCLDDNTGSVACINKGYSHNKLNQVMQLLSNLRQTVDEAPMEGSYCNTLNMSWFDQGSRRKWAFLKAMNKALKEEHMHTWVQDEPCEGVKLLSQWLPDAWESDLPFLANLAEQLVSRVADNLQVKNTMSATDVLEAPDDSWQKRIAAAVEPIDCWMGSFGPKAYDTSHLSDPAETGANGLRFEELRKKNQAMAQGGNYKAADAYSGGCGMTMSAISAGLCVVTGYEIAKEEIKIFEQATGQRNLGNMDNTAPEKRPKVDVWCSCSSCKDYSRLSRKQQGIYGSNGGDHFTGQCKPAAEANASAIIFENVWDVATLHGGIALTTLVANCKKLGYKLAYKKVQFAKFGDPENRSRCVMVGFHNTVQLPEEWKFPEVTEQRRCAGEVLMASTHIHEKYWDDREYHSKTQNWGSADTLRIFTLGFCDNNEDAGSPDKPNRVWHMMGLFPTCLASGNTGLVMAMWLRLWCPKYTAFKDWADSSKTWVKRSGNKREVGRQRKRKVIPVECQESKQFCKGYPQLSDEVGYRVAGNAVPVPYFTKLLESVVVALTSAGVPRQRDGNNTNLSFEDLSLNASPEVEGAEAEVEQNVRKSQTDQSEVKISKRQTNQVTWHQCKHGWVSLQEGAELRAGFDQEKCTKPECIEPLKKKQLKRKQKAARKKARAEAESTGSVGHCFHGEAPEWLPFIGPETGMNDETSAGYHRLYNKRRGDIEFTPVAAAELSEMAKVRASWKLAKAEGTARQVQDSWKHWQSFCKRFKLTPILKPTKPEDYAAAAAQVELFALYELACFKITAKVVNRKINQIGDCHIKMFRLPNPFAENSVIKGFMRAAMALDPVSRKKCPISNAVLAAIKSSLNTVTREGLCVWTGIRFAICFLCRISEWAFKDQYSVKWKHINFYTKERKLLDILCEADIKQVYEMEVIFYSSKTFGPEHAEARNFFAIENEDDPRCLLRDMARLWLMSERCKEYHVFGWDNDTKGVRRTFVNKMLKEAAKQCGMPAEDISSHSARVTGLSRLVAHGLPWIQCRTYGRWLSDCAFTYLWASTDIALGYAEKIWDPPRFARCRGGGAVQHYN